MTFLVSILVLVLVMVVLAELGMYALLDGEREKERERGRGWSYRRSEYSDIATRSLTQDQEYRVISYPSAFSVIETDKERT